MIPGPTLLWACVALAGVGFAFPLLEAWLPSWPALAYVVAGVALTDAFFVFRQPRMSAERIVQGNLPLGVGCDVVLRVRRTVEQAGQRPVTVQLWDHHPASFEVVDFPCRIKIPVGPPVRIQYSAMPRKRGEHAFGPIEMRIRSPLGFWWRTQRQRVSTSVRVYPNFSPVAKFIRLSVDARATLLGVRRLRRRGAGSEFHELRDYRRGDSMRQIDWRATSRTRRLISRSYQDERDQRVVFMLDCGRRMRAAGSTGLSHFDESLNAVLLLAYMALRQGDSVAMGTFGTGEAAMARWMGPVKGPGRVNDVLNMLYDLEPSTQMPDYVGACTTLLARHQKHALVVLVTNLRGEDASDLIPALRLLRRRHLVLVASLRESELDGPLNREVESLSDALQVMGVHQLHNERAQVLAAMRTDGILALDVPPAALSAELVNAYLTLKASRSI
ncbi:MAG: hypothetical protein ACI9W2_001478 [Gammaproteobacteria bacterium]|jgi:uncharacterized protein (DUF58 family)